MPKLTMKAQISGTRNGTSWPKPGQTIEVSDGEAKALVRNGLAAEPDGDADTKKAPAKKTTKKASGSA